MDTLSIPIILMAVVLVLSIYAGYTRVYLPSVEILTLPSPDPKREELSTVDATAGGKL